MNIPPRPKLVLRSRQRLPKGAPLKQRIEARRALGYRDCRIPIHELEALIARAESNESKETKDAS